MANSTSKLNLKQLFVRGNTENQSKWNKLIDSIFSPVDTPEYSSIKTDNIDEKTASFGVTIDGILVKDNTITAERRSIINVTTASVTLTAAQSGSLVILDRAAGSTVTLPTGAVGVYYDFFVKTSVTSNSYTVTAPSGDIYFGSVNIHSTASADKVTQFSPDLSDDRNISMNGSTTGGVSGSVFRVTYIAENRWFINGILNGTGTFTSPFS